MLFSLVASAQLPGRKKRTVTDDEVKRVHHSAILIDTHNDVTSFTLDEGYDIGKRDTTGKHMTDLPRMKAGGMSAQFFAAYVEASYAKDNKSADRALQMIDTVLNDIVAKYPERFSVRHDIVGNSQGV